MPDVQWTELSDRGVVAVSGPDAAHFLHNLVTTNVETLAVGAARYGALLTPQGKVQFDFIIFGAPGRYFIDVARSHAADFAKRLGFYKLRAAVDIRDISQTHQVIAAWGDSPLPTNVTDAIAAAPDPRHERLGVRIITAAIGTISAPAGWIHVEAEAYDAHRIALCIPAGGVDFAYGDAFPHEADIDQLGGIDFRKGCYTGQEVVSRMEHRGTARRRIIALTGIAPLPAPGTAIEAAGREIGTMGSADGTTALASVRLDRAREALDAGASITAGGAVVSLAIPDWARFGWPQAAAE